MTTFAQFTESYLSVRVVSPMYAANLRRRAKALELFAGDCRIECVLTEANLNAFLAQLTCTPHTRKSYRGDLLSLWRAAADENLAVYPNTRRVRRERLPALIVQCYDTAEARKLLASAARLRGALANGVPRRDYWGGLIRCAWESGLRRGDLWKLRRDAIRPDGAALMVQNKTGRIVHVRLRPASVEAIDRIGRAEPFAWPHAGWTFGEQFQRLVKASGVNRGSFRWLRRSAGSYVEAAQPGAGHRHLGHNSQATFTNHYDAQLGGASWPLPPALD